MTFFRRVSVGVLAAGLAMTLSACTVNINSGDSAARDVVPMDDAKAQVLACKVYHDHYLAPIRATGDTVPSLETAAEFIDHQKDAIAELSKLPGEVPGVLTTFHEDQLSYWQWHHDVLASGDVLDSGEMFRRWSLLVDLPDTTRDVCWQYIE